MTSRILKKHGFLIIFIIALVVVGWLVLGRSSVKKLDHPEYLTFAGNYVFSVPEGYSVDEQSIQGLQIVSSKDKGLQGKTIDQIYADNNISLQSLDFLKDKKGDSFKQYINQTLAPEQKQKLATQDVKAEFSKLEGWDVAKLTIKKDGQPLRFIFIKEGKHPTSIVSKEENPVFKKIESSVTDVEKTDLKSQVKEIKDKAQSVAKQIRAKEAANIYSQAAPEFRSKNPQSDLEKLLTSAEVFTQGEITINGGSYDGSEFGAAAGFIPLNTDFKRASGVMYFKKIDKQWKLTGLQLPAPVKIQQ